MRLITSLLNWLQRCPTTADGHYHRAMDESHDVLKRMKDIQGDDPARMIIADVLLHRENAPYITTLYEALQEMNAGAKQRLN